MNDEKVTRCYACHEAAAVDGPEPFCAACARRIPRALLKALIDPFDYALRLTTGEVVRFGSARIDGDWVTLSDAPGETPPKGDRPVTGLKYPCPRGVEVRIDQIVWIADAPEGS